MAQHGIELRFLTQYSPLPLCLVRRPEIVVIEECEELAVRFPDTKIARGSRACVLLVQVPDRRRIDRADDERRIVIGTVIDDDDLAARQGLLQHALNGVRNETRTIMCRNNNTDVHRLLLHHYTPDNSAMRPAKSGGVLATSRPKFSR